ncbi:hypothetical protein [Delftia phage PhiW-14]|uniref:Uncharacterized protein n=1 Tax=Delftia phage PhiW-14 TaxID=665032 RepID=C9DG50_BPW14|nr:hypothetical protein DP-phiW-14_gp079 [Delftia phage PhiW-14]ACV50101.1 hypothetical protein [Delftia phage PhiW-14]
MNQLQSNIKSLQDKHGDKVTVGATGLKLKHPNGYTETLISWPLGTEIEGLVVQPVEPAPPAPEVKPAEPAEPVGKLPPAEVTPDPEPVKEPEQPVVEKKKPGPKPKVAETKAE